MYNGAIVSPQNSYNDNSKIVFLLNKEMKHCNNLKYLNNLVIEKQRFSQIGDIINDSGPEKCHLTIGLYTRLA